MQKRQASSYAWLVWALGASFFLFEYVTRVAPSVMAQDLMRTFHVYALGIGTLSGLFYYSYVSMQLPVGMLVDRFGPHKLLTVMALICAAGSLLFASSTHILQADLGRLMIGFGAAFAFVGCLKLATTWFPASKFALLAGMTQALGMVGAAVGEGPMSLLVSHAGWRPAMYISAGVFLVLAILIGIIVRDKPTFNPHPHDHITPEERHKMWQGLVQVCKNPKSWMVAGYAGFIYASSAGFGELWGVSFLKRVYGLPKHDAATAIGFIFIGWAIGAPIVGWMSKFVSRRLIMTASALCGFVIFCIFLTATHLTTGQAYALTFIYGLTNTGLIVGYALASFVNGVKLSGTSLAFSNMASVIVGALLQPILGWVLGLNWNGQMLNGAPMYSVHDYKSAMIVFPICFLIAACFGFFPKKTINTVPKNA